MGVMRIDRGAVTHLVSCAMCGYRTLTIGLDAAYIERARHAVACDPSSRAARSARQVAARASRARERKAKEE